MKIFEENKKISEDEKGTSDEAIGKKDGDENKIDGNETEESNKDTSKEVEEKTKSSQSDKPNSPWLLRVGLAIFEVATVPVPWPIFASDAIKWLLKGVLKSNKCVRKSIKKHNKYPER